jgi:hypothetical protein
MNCQVIILCILICMLKSVQPALYNKPSCNIGQMNSARCQQSLSKYRKAFFIDNYGNIKERLTFADYLNHFKAAGYGFSNNQIAAEAKLFYKHANGVGYQSICTYCGDGDGHMNLMELWNMHRSNDTAKLV